MSSSYSQYKGQSMGRQMHCLSVLLEGTSSIHADDCLFGHDKVTGKGRISIWNQKLADVDWEGDSDIPTFKFYDLGESDYEKVAARLERAQYIKKSFYDNPRILYNITYAVQEVRKVLTFDQALYLVWIRDKHNCDWTLGSDSYRAEIKVKVCEVINKAYYGSLPQEDLDVYWTHFCLAAIYGTSNDY